MQPRTVSEGMAISSHTHGFRYHGSCSASRRRSNDGDVEWRWIQHGNEGRGGRIARDADDRESVRNDGVPGFAFAGALAALLLASFVLHEARTLEAVAIQNRAQPFLQTRIASLDRDEPQWHHFVPPGRRGGS